MSLYNKKLHIKKPNGVVQTANLYTDKNDVGNNYLTFRDGGNTIYSVLDVNGDIDCKIRKNNINYKIKKENVIILKTERKLTTPFDFTIPNGVTMLQISIVGSIFKYVKVSPNTTYKFLWYYEYGISHNRHYSIDILAIKNTLNGKTIQIYYNDIDKQGNPMAEQGAIIWDTNLSGFDCSYDIQFYYSSEINKATPHADLT